MKILIGADVVPTVSNIEYFKKGDAKNNTSQIAIMIVK